MAHATLLHDTQPTLGCETEPPASDATVLGESIDTICSNDYTETPRSLLTSLLFWCFLACAVGLYAAMALSPKLWTYVRLMNQFRTEQVRLVALEDQIQYLKKVAVALEGDPEFTAELARSDLAGPTPNEERIAVEPSLSWDSRVAETLPDIPPARLPWYAAILRLLAENQSLRRMALFVAATVTILSFTFLHESQTARVASTVSALHRILGLIARRYKRNP